MTDTSIFLSAYYRQPGRTDGSAPERLFGKLEEEQARERGAYLSERPSEQTYASDLKEWINQIVKEDALPFSYAKVEILKEKKRMDILLYDANIVCKLIIEVKRPEDSPSDPEVVKQAFNYAQDYRKSGLKYFATHNGNFVIFWDALTGKKVDQFSVTYLTTLDDYQRKTEEIKESFRRVLRWYAKFLEGEPPKPIDEAIIEILNGFIQGIVSSTKLVAAQMNAYVRDPDYRKRFEEWLLDKGWEEPMNETRKLEEYCVVLAKQFLYIYANKVLFYNVLRQRNPSHLPVMGLPKGLSSENIFTFLDTYFQLAIKTSGDYETVFQTNFVDRIPLPSDAITEIVKATDYLNTLEYSNIGYDIIGKVLEKLIPREERHTLGQYFTRSDVVDLILGFCLRRPGDILLDPACGTGTFLVRGYYRLRYLEGQKNHPELLRQLWGVDIDKFPAHLATINLAIRDLSVGDNYPNVVYGDFFDLPGPKTSIRIGMQPTLAPWTGKGMTPTAEVTGLDAKVFEREIPSMDCVVGNPPYTRQEEMGAEVFGEKYKERLGETVAADFPGLDLPQRSGIYAYFFPHGAKFLNERGRMGFVCLRAWLDTGYGSALKKFVCNHFKVVAVVESKSERWFPDAQMLPCIVILEVSNDKAERDLNLVKFVQLKAPLADFLPRIRDERDMLQEIYRWKKADEFASLVESAERSQGAKRVTFLGRDLELYEDEKLRIVSVKQSFLESDPKWGKFLSAPSVFFKVLERGGDKLVPLRKVANVNLGIKTGANEFFVLPNKSFDTKASRQEYVIVDKVTQSSRFTIEKAFLHPVVVKIKPHREIGLKKPDGNILMVHQSFAQLGESRKHVLDYLRYGEEKTIKLKRGRGKGKTIVGYQNIKSIKGRKPWYDLGIRDPPALIFPSIFWARHVVFLNMIGAQATNAFFEVHPNRKDDIKTLCALLNSTLTALLSEFAGRYIENRDKTISNQIMVYEVGDLPVIDPHKLTLGQRKMLQTAIEDLIDKPIGLRAMYDPKDLVTREVLDRIVFCDILGLSMTEMQEARQALADIVRGRVERLQLPKKAGRLKAIPSKQLVTHS